MNKGFYGISKNRTYEAPISASWAATASFATSASFATTASYTTVFPYTGSAIITGSIDSQGSIKITVNNTDYTNTDGTGSHIILSNPNPSGQNVLSSYINGNLVAKWRTDYVGNISWVAGTTGAHTFYTKGDYGVGVGVMQIFNNGNTIIGRTSVGGGFTDAGYKLDVSGSGRFTNELTVSSSVTINDVLTLPPVSPLPSGKPVGSFAVSGSGVNCKPYFYNGTTWTPLF